MQGISKRPRESRRLAALVIGCALAASLAACGSDDDSSSAEAPTASSAAEAAPPTTAEADSTAEAAAETAAASSAEETTETSAETATSADVTTADATGEAAADTSSLQEASPGWKTGTPNARRVAFAPADDTQPVRIAFLSASDANAYWHQVAVSVDEVAKARNGKVDVFDAGFDPGKQQSQFQDALATGNYDAFVIVPVDGPSLVPLVKQAVEKGAQVVSTGDFALGPDYGTIEPQVEGMAGVAQTSNQRIAEDLANLTIEACDGDDACKVAWIPGVATTPAEVYETDVIKEQLAPHGNIELVAVQNGEFLADPARAAAQNILQAHPDLDVFVTAGDQMAYGAQLAVKDAGKSDTVKTIGLGGSFEGVEQVRAGEMFGTAPLLPYDDGLYAADIALRAVRGQPIENPVIDPVDASGIPRAITKDVTDEFADFAGQFKNT